MIKLLKLVAEKSATTSGNLPDWWCNHQGYGWISHINPITTYINISFMKFATVYPKKYAHGFVVLCFVVVMQSFIMNSHEVFIHIHQGCFAGTGAIVRLPKCQWSKPDGYGKISQCITKTKHSKAKTVCIFLGIYCMCSVGFIIEPVSAFSLANNLGHYNENPIWWR